MATKYVERYRGLTVWYWEGNNYQNNHYIEIPVHDETGRYRFSQNIKEKLTFDEVVVFINDLYGDDTSERMWFAERNQRDIFAVSERGYSITNEDIIIQLKEKLGKNKII